MLNYLYDASDLRDLKMVTIIREPMANFKSVFNYAIAKRNLQHALCQISLFTLSLGAVFHRHAGIQESSKLWSKYVRFSNYSERLQIALESFGFMSLDRKCNRNS